ncbi:MAG: hypothetical protein OEY33_00660 [Bdellovibrionales bacterium]|jgi:hypothetical protein|nr:hypothetical protein [Bdellovibrionales bacterium]
MKFILFFILSISTAVGITIPSDTLKTKILENSLRCPNLNGSWKGKCENVDTREVMSAQILITHTNCSTLKLNNSLFYPGTTQTETTSGLRGNHTQTTHSYWHNQENGFTLKISAKVMNYNNAQHLEENHGVISMKRTNNYLELTQLNKVITAQGKEKRELLKCGLNI